MQDGIKKLYELNPEILTSKKRCIFGTGVHARQTYIDLSIQGIKIDYFADRDVNDAEASFMGVPLINEEKLKELNVSVIVASTFWEDISERLMKQGITDLFVDLHRYGEVSVQNHYLDSVGKYHMEKDTLYILCPAGIGDTLYVAAYAKAAKEYYVNIKKVCLITKQNHACVGSFFKGVDEVIASDQLVEWLDLYSISTNTWYLENYIYGHFKKNLCQTFDMEYTENKNNLISDYYKRFTLRLPTESKLDVFHYNLKGIEKISILKNKQFIILMPYANTAKMVTMDFWEKCADFFLKKHYVVFTNVKDETEPEITGTLPVSENIYNMVGICSLAKLVISIRNGMCDVLSMGKAPLIVLDTEKEFYEKWNTNQLGGRSIHIWCREKSADDIFEEVINQFENKIGVD